MSVVWAWVGAPTSDGATVSFEIEGGTATLLVADNQAMTGAVPFPPVTVDGNGVGKIQALGLDASTDYWYQIQDDGVTDTSLTGHFRTHPPVGSAASYSIVAGSCAGVSSSFPGALGDELAPTRISNSPIFNTIRLRDPLMWIHLGDRGYYDLGSGLHGITGGGSLANYRALYRDNSRQPNQLALQSQVATAYAYDDHDWGPNDSDGTIPGRNNSLAVYRQMVPHFPMALGDEPVDQYWQIGRVAFAMIDCRADSVPNSTPDGPGKTMLGASQKARFEQFLATSNAEALVWLMSRQWMGTSNDSWAVFHTERQELVQLLDQYDWLHRMVCIYGDRHALGLDTGGNNVNGGFPVLQAASYDTSFPSSPVNSRFDTGPDLPGRNHYGVIDVVDTGGSTIDITLSGFVDTTLWRSHTLTIDVDVPPEPPPPLPPIDPPVAQAQIRERVMWLGCDLASGRIIATLPELRGNVERLIGQPRSTGLELPIPLSGPGSMPIALVEQVVVPGRTMLVAVLNDIPTWAGIVMGPTSSGTNATVTMPCVTLEGYLDRRVVRDHSWTNVDLSSVIAAGLVGDAGDIPGVGVGIGLEIDAPPSGVLIDREYLLSDRRTVLQALQELSTVQGGVEWTIDIDWTDNTNTTIRKIFRARQRLGRVADSAPNTVFQTAAHSVFQSRGASEAKYQLRQDYGIGRGANYVVAYSSGQGEDQPASIPAIATQVLDSGFPIYEQHYQPDTDLTDVDTLNAHSQAELLRRQNGWEAFYIEARWDAYPRYGVDWELGDDVAWSLYGHRHPGGVQGRGRVIGFTLDMRRQVIIPILYEEE